MVRTDNDSWDLATSVGATATGVAAARAVASRGTSPMINDPFAEPLVRAVGVDFFTRLACGQVDPADVDESVFGVRRMTDMVSVRTRFFDEFFLEAAQTGIRQAVILASGLDARAYRLPWPAGMSVYEIDQPQVIEFKTNTLADLGAAPTADRRTVAIDLRHDWPTALRRAGFDATESTAWSAEALLPFLPSEAQDRLLDNITALSSVGSRLATENVPNLGQVASAMTARMRTVTDRWRDQGLDIDMTDLVYADSRNDVADYLDTHGWQTVGASVAELFVANGLSPLEDDEEFTSLIYLSATRQ